jgi:hypothetical protein
MSGADATGWRAHTGSEAFRAAVRELIAGGLDWLEAEPLRRVLPPERLRAWIGEDSDPARVDERRELFERLWAEGEARLRAETRPLHALLGPALTAEALRLAERLEPSERMVRAAFEQGASADLLSAVLYDGIMAFFQRADLLGPLIDRIPVIGGIRRKIMGGLKEEFERRLEGQVRAALTDIARVGVERAIAFVLAPENREKFRRMRRALAEKALARSPAQLMPDAATVTEARDAVWQKLREEGSRTERLQRWADAGYERFGDRTAAELRRAPDYPTVRARAEEALTHLWHAFLQTDAAERWYRAHPLPPG